MLKYFYRMRRKKGFTMVELIVVIAIIGVLSAIIIPVVSGYVQKAKKANDKLMGKEIYNSVMNLIAEDREAWKAFHQITSGYQHLTEWIATDDGYADPKQFGNGKSPKDGEYKIVVVAKMDGAKAIDKAAFAWLNGNKEQYDFILRLNMKLGLWDAEGNLTDKAKDMQNHGDYLFKMKATSHSDGKNTDRWLICYQKDNPSAIEIWTGDSFSAGRSGTTYRIYPDPCIEYE